MTPTQTKMPENNSSLAVTPVSAKPVRGVIGTHTEEFIG